jgi:hypothetical protein
MITSAKDAQNRMGAMMFFGVLISLVLYHMMRVSTLYVVAFFVVWVVVLMPIAFVLMGGIAEDTKEPHKLHW